jgi:hypothetical protein
MTGSLAVALIATAISNNDAAGLATLIADYPRHVTFNESRGAIQISGCRGPALIGHYPVPTAMTHFLRSSLAAPR